jgi:hypothetical protein
MTRKLKWTRAIYVVVHAPDWQHVHQSLRLERPGSSTAERSMLSHNMITDHLSKASASCSSLLLSKKVEMVLQTLPKSSSCSPLETDAAVRHRNVSKCKIYELSDKTADPSCMKGIHPLLTQMRSEAKEDVHSIRFQNMIGSQL